MNEKVIEDLISARNLIYQAGVKLHQNNHEFFLKIMVMHKELSDLINSDK